MTETTRSGAEISGAYKEAVDREGDEIFLAPIWIAIERHYQIKAQMAALKEEDALIVAWLDKQNADDIAALGIKRKPVISYSVNPDIAAEIMNGDAHLQEVLQPCLRWKCELNLKPYKALNESDFTVFSQAITSKPGKTEYTCNELEPKKETYK